MTVHPFLKGHQIQLRSLTRSDLPLLCHWNDDKDVTRYLVRGIYPSQLEKATQSFEQSLQSENQIEMIVEDKLNQLPIGISGLYELDYRGRSAEFRILIGEKAYWNKGIGTEVVQILTSYGFENLNLHRVYLGVNSLNLAAVKSYEKSGFVREGELRDVIYRNGTYYNVIQMSLLRAEYQALKATWQLVWQG